MEQKQTVNNGEGTAEEIKDFTDIDINSDSDVPGNSHFNIVRSSIWLTIPAN